MAKEDLSATSDAVNKVLEKLNELGPSVTEAVLNAASWSAVNNLIFGGICLLVSIYFSHIANESMKKTTPELRKSNYEEYDRYVNCGLFAGFIAIAAICGSLYHISNTINYVGIYHPEVYLAHKFIPH